MKYYIKDNYTHRTEVHYNDDFETCAEHGDIWQEEVYDFAKKLIDDNNLSSIIDFGCGSASKTLRYFGDKDLVALDLPKTIERLIELHPNNKWTSDINELPSNCDLFFSADAIEHMEDPDVLIELIKKLLPKHIVLSTPHRDLIGEAGLDGPPTNIYHMREWTYREFHKYISKHFKIIKHDIVNVKHGTQMVYAQLK